MPRWCGAWILCTPSLGVLNPSNLNHNLMFYYINIKPQSGDMIFMLLSL